MVDTIVFRVLNLNKYKLLHEQFKISTAKKNQIFDIYNEVDSEGVVTAREKKLVRGRFYSDSSKFLPLSLSFELRSPSHNYNVRAVIRYAAADEPFLEVEMSLPKYFYGTNLFQLLAHSPTSSEGNFAKLVESIKKFCKTFFAQIPSDFDIQIFRLDMCYNQFFADKAEALSYQQAQNEHMRISSASRNVRFVSHSDNKHFNYVLLSERYSFKCYHKGTEFEKHDAVQLAKSGKQSSKLARGSFRNPATGELFGNKQKHSYDVGELQSIADRCLRYELTFRSSYINYLTMYAHFVSVDERRPLIKQSNLWLYLRRIERMNVIQRRSYYGDGADKLGNVYDYFQGKQKDFCLKSGFDLPFSPGCIEYNKVSFNYAVYRLMFDCFWDNVKATQISTRSSVPEMVDRINRYQDKLRIKKEAKNTKKGSMIRKGSVHFARLLSVALLSQHMDLRLLKGYYPDSTYRNLMRDLKKAGIDTKAYELNISQPRLDYQDNLIYLTPKINHIL